MKRIAKPKRHYYVCIDGPWAGEIAYLPEETMVFTAKSMTGQYTRGIWYNVR